jgi:ribonuclease D
VFDTQVAWALLGPEYSVSLAYLQYRLLGIRSGKAHQADDWKRRPLPPSQLAYAASDIEHLPELRNLLHDRAARLGRERMVVEASLETVWPEAEAAAPLALESFRNAWQLDRKNQAALKALIEWHNALDPAKRRLAPEPKTLLSIANRLPENAGELGHIKGVSRGFCQQSGAELVARMSRAAREALDGDFEVIEPPAYATFEEIRLDALLGVARAEICATLQVAPELALPGRLLRPMKAALLAEADVGAALGFLKGWREELLSRAFIDFFERHPLPGRGAI